jgi:hypothetical protein
MEKMIRADEVIFEPLDSLNVDLNKLVLAQRRQRKETLREVYLDSKEYVYKRYIIKSQLPFYVKPWLNETRALIRANGLHTAHHVNLYKGVNSEVYLEVVHQKEFIVGEPLEVITAEYAKKLGLLLAGLHKLRIVMRDPHKNNFFENDAVNIYVVDMGKAHLHRFKSPLYFYNIGSEFAKLKYRTIGTNVVLWDIFLQTYFQDNVMSAPFKKMVMLSYYLCEFTRKKRRNLWDYLPLLHSPIKVINS